MTKTEQRLSDIERSLAATKRILNFREAAAYLNFSESYLYKLTSLRRVPCFKPSGKKLFFDRLALDNFLMQNPVMTGEQIDCSASTYITNALNGITRS